MSLGYRVWGLGHKSIGFEIYIFSVSNNRNIIYLWINECLI